MHFVEAPIRVIARPKLSGFGEHVGVQLPSGHVAHHTPQGNEVVSLEQFAQGRPVHERKHANPADRDHILRRVASSVGGPSQYRLADSNCEHYASWLIGDEPESPQVAGCAVVALVAGFLLAGAR